VKSAKPRRSGSGRDGGTAKKKRSASDGRKAVERRQSSMAKGTWPAETYPFECPHYSKALDPHIAQAYWGYDVVSEWPYTRIIPKGSAPPKCDYCAGTSPIRAGFPFA
jgi:hypothetical protein